VAAKGGEVSILLQNESGGNTFFFEPAVNKEAVVKHALGPGLIGLLLISSTLAIEKPKDAMPKLDTIKVYQVADPTEVLLKYETLLSEEAKEHRQFLERQDERFYRFITIFGAMALFLLGFLNYKSRRDIRDLVNERFQKDVGSAIQGKLDEYDAVVRGRATQLGALILELSRRIPSAEDPSEAYSIDPAKLRNKNVLWVDDNPERNSFPVSVLKEAGIIFTAARSTDEAINLINRTTPTFDLIITNIGRSPDRQAGITLLKKINEIKSHIPVIVFSRPETIRKYAETALDLGARKCVTGYSQIMTEVQAMLGK
jgi:CheY-like chemotaxis protein